MTLVNENPIFLGSGFFFTKDSVKYAEKGLQVFNFEPDQEKHIKLEEMKEKFPNYNPICLHLASYDSEFTTRLDTFIENNKLQDTKINFLHIEVTPENYDSICSLGNYILNVDSGIIENLTCENASRLEKYFYMNNFTTSIDDSNMFFWRNLLSREFYILQT